MKINFDLESYNDIMYWNLLRYYNLCVEYLKTNKESASIMKSLFYNTFMDYSNFIECCPKGILYDKRISEIYEKMVIIKNNYFE